MDHVPNPYKLKNKEFSYGIYLRTHYVRVLSIRVACQEISARPKTLSKIEYRVDYVQGLDELSFGVQQISIKSTT